MSLVFNLGIIGTILTFLVGILMTFPGQTAQVEQSTPAQQEEQFDVEKVNDFAELFAGGYLSVIDDISSHQAAPEYNRADAKREEMTAYGNSLVIEFDGFQEMLADQLNGLEIPEATPTPQSTPTP
jgi:hypothetical protein